MEISLSDMGGMCKCPHHVVTKILYMLSWVSAVGFWWAEFSDGYAWGMSQEYFFQSVVVMMLLAFGSKFCGCCGGHVKMMMGGMDAKMCSHEGGCKCGDCGRCR